MANADGGRPSGGSVRYHSLDALRAWMMLLGLVFHVAWLLLPQYFFNARADSQGHTGFQYFFGWVHVFRMQAFFVIAGFFANLLVTKRGVLSFVRNRFWRVLLPFVVSMIVLFPLIRWQEIRGGFMTGRIQSSLGVWEYTLNHFLELPGKWGGQWPYHFWFLETLCLVYLIAIGLWLVFAKVLDRDKRFRHRVQRFFEWVVGSRWCIPVLAVPVAGLLFWADTWFGISTGGLEPLWLGTINYWFIFAVGWCLYSSPELISRISRHWRLKMAIGSVIALGLAAIWVDDWGKHRNRVGVAQPKMNLTIVRDYPMLRQRLLNSGDTEIDSVRRAVFALLSDDFQEFLEHNETMANSDQAFGLVGEFNSNVIDSLQFATPGRCQALGVVEDPRWGRWASRPISERTEDARAWVNLLLLQAAFPDSLHPHNPRPALESAAYFYLYALSTWLLVNAWFGFFEEYFSGNNPKVRYYSDSAYWLYLLHVVVQFEMSLWLGDLEWPVPVKFIVYLAGTFLVTVTTYHYLVRSTWIGRWLNGRRYDREPFLVSAILPSSTGTLDSDSTPAD